MEQSTAASLHVNDSTATAETLLSQRMPTADGTSAYPAATTATDGYGGAELSVSPAVAKAALDLQTHGWAVVEDVIPRAECEAYIDRVWGWLEGLGTGLMPPRPRTPTPAFMLASCAPCRMRARAHITPFIWVTSPCVGLGVWRCRSSLIRCQWASMSIFPIV